MKAQQVEGSKREIAVYFRKCFLPTETRSVSERPLLIAQPVDTLNLHCMPNRAAAAPVEINGGGGGNVATCSGTHQRV